MLLLASVVCDQQYNLLRRMSLQMAHNDGSPLDGRPSLSCIADIAAPTAGPDLVENDPTRTSNEPSRREGTALDI